MIRKSLILVAMLATGSFAQNDNDKPLPIDPKITIGTLENGLKYYIRENKKPEERAELRLVINAGSVLEDDDQQGLAHFVEHMAFNGTKNFAKHEIVNYLESIGMEFGPDINAYTSFDETVYMLQAPTDSTEIVEKAFQILEEWAHNVSFDQEEIDKERGVVIEEWRLGRGAGARLRDKQLPVLFKDSRYAQRLPIGEKEILETAPYDALTRFYSDWYRPDLMAVIAIGDFDSDWIEKLIKDHFAEIKSPKNPRKRLTFAIPDHQETLFAIASDPEATRTNVSAYYKYDGREEGTEGAYRKQLVESLYNSMLNNRLRELLKTPEPPFLFAYSSQGQIVRTKQAYILGAGVRDDGIEEGLEAVLTEAARVKYFGFTESELLREKAEMLRAVEVAYNERDKSESDDFAAEYTRNFLTDEPIPGIEYEFMLYNKFIPGIALQEVNGLAEQWIQEQNRVILVSQPEKESIKLPTEAQLSGIFEKVADKKIEPYLDKVTDEPLISGAPRPGSIVSQNEIAEIGVHEWQLSNGVQVVLKPTDFKNDEVVFTARSPGGHSLVSDANYIPAISAAPIVQHGGVGAFDQIALEKKLAGKLVSVSPWISELQEGFSGNATPKDIETLFQLIHLYFTQPRKDSTAFLSFQNRIKGLIANRHASPQAAYQDTIDVTMSSYSFRSRPWSEAMMDEMNLQTSLSFYRDRFADAGDFTFFFVGAFDPDTLRPYVETYLASLPSLNRSETWRDIGVRPPKGIVDKSVFKGLEAKSQVSIIFTGEFDWSRENTYLLSSMADIVEIKLREVLREDLGGTYGVGVWADGSRYPYEEYSINISFGCAPERVSELTQTVFLQLDSLKTHGTTGKYLDKIKEKQRRSRETSLKENGFWLNALTSYYYHGDGPTSILDYDRFIDDLTLEKIRQAAGRYFNTGRFVKVTLFPEDFETSM